MEIVQTMDSDPGLAVGETTGAGGQAMQALLGAGPEERQDRGGPGLRKAEPGWVAWTLGLGVLYSKGQGSGTDPDPGRARAKRAFFSPRLRPSMA